MLGLELVEWGLGVGFRALVGLGFRLRAYGL